MIEQQNHILDERCVELLGKLDDNGLHGTILKGQGVAILYDKELRPMRQSGDIDVYVDCGFEKALSTVQGIEGLTVEGWDYQHAHLVIWDDAVVELHYRVEVIMNLFKNRRLQKWIEKHSDQLFEKREGLVTPTIDFNVLYILMHLYRHFLYEGVGLKQVMDYYMVLRAVHVGRSDVKEYVNAVSEFGMTKFSKGLMWVMKKVFAMPDEWMLWEPDEKEGSFILEQMMAGGNFGHYDKRLSKGNGKIVTLNNVVRHNWHLFSHYPSEFIWPPVWLIWHKCWKLKTKALMAIR